MGDPAHQPGEIAGYASAAVVFLTAIGAGISRLIAWRRVERKTRAAGLQEWEGKLRAREEALDAKIDQRLRTLEAENSERRAECSALRIAFELVAGALRTIDPENTALGRAEQVLATAFPIASLSPTAEMAEHLRSIDRADMAATAAARRNGG